MNILSIGLDKGLFDRNSDVYWRHKHYATFVDQYTVIAPTLRREKKTLFNEKNLSVIPSNSSLKILSSIDCLFAAWGIRERKFDLVTVQDPFLTAIAGILIKFTLKIPLNIQIHSEFFNSKYFREEKILNIVFYYLGILTLNFADTVRARNKRIAHWVVNKYPHLKSKVFYVPAPINKIFLTELSKVKRTPNLIVTNGRLTAQKNYPLLFTAFQSVLHKIPTAKLWIVGNGEEEQKIKKLVCDLNLTNQVKFFGWIDPQKWKQILEVASVFVLASSHEGWGLVCLEALARGTPVVMTDTGCAGEIIIDNKTGIVVPVESEKKLAAGIKQVLRSPKKYQKMAVLGRKLVEKDSSEIFLKKRMLSMYKNTISL